MAGEGESGLAKLFRLHHAGLMRFVARFADSSGEIEDLAQAAYLKLAEAAIDTRTLTHPRTYLFSAARNAALDRAARRRTERRHRDTRAGFDLVASQAPLPDAAVAARQRLRRLAEALNELPADCREAFVLNKLEGFGHKAIAARLGISVSMVEKHIVRALRHCRARVFSDEA